MCGDLGRSEGEEESGGDEVMRGYTTGGVCLPPQWGRVEGHSAERERGVGGVKEGHQCDGGETAMSLEARNSRNG